MKEFKLPVKIASTVIRGKEVSTVKLNSMGHKRKRYETCIFTENASCEWAVYSTAKDAHLGHMSLVTKLLIR